MRAADADGQLTTLSYEAAGNLLQVREGAAQPRRWLYDGWGRARKLTDAQGNAQWREHDLLGRVVSIHEPDGNVRRLAYDGLDKLTRTQDRNHDVQHVYRGLGRMVGRSEAAKQG